MFDRLPRGIRLTDAGALLADYARRMDVMENAAERAIAELRGFRRGRLAIGASTTVGAYLLPRALARFHKAYPNIELCMEIANTRDIQQALLDGKLEAGFTEGRVESDELETTVFQQDELVAVAPPGHDLFLRKRVTARSFCKDPIVMREAGSGTRQVVEAALAAKGITVTPVIALGSTEAIKRAVIEGLGVAIVSRLAIGQELESKRLRIVPLHDLTIRRPLHLQKLRDKTLGTAVAGFLRFVR